MTVLDRTALGRGALVSLVFAIPFSVAMSIVAGADGDSGWQGLLFLGAFGGFVLGAGVAAWVQDRGLPFLHGMVAAGGTYLATQSVFTVVRLARGESISAFALLFTFTFVLLAGVIGGALGSVLRRRGLVPGMRGSALDGRHDHGSDGR